MVYVQLTVGPVPSIFLRTLDRCRSRSIFQMVDIDEEFSTRSRVNTAWYGEESLDGEVRVGIIVSLAMAGSQRRYGFYPGSTSGGDWKSRGMLVNCQEDRGTGGENRRKPWILMRPLRRTF